MSSSSVSQSVSIPRLPEREGLARAATHGAAAAAALNAAQPLPPRERALAGFRIAAGTPPAGAGPLAQALADAPANARTALARTDLSPAQAVRLQTVVERLGNEVIDGRIAPQMNNEFRQKLYDLATAAPDSPQFRGAMAHMGRAAEVLDRVELAKGTAMAFDPKSAANLADAGLPLLDVPDLDSDLCFKTRDGVLHIESAKAGANTLAGELKDSAEGKHQQLNRQSAWQALGTDEAPRRLGLYAADDSVGFDSLMHDRNRGELRRVVGDAGQRSIVLGERAYSVGEIDQLANAATADMQHYVAAQADVEAGGETKGGSPYRDYARKYAQSPQAVMERVNIQVGEAQRPLQALPPTEMPTARQGGLWGGVVSAGVSTASAAWDGQITVQEGLQIASQTAVGAGAGAVTAAGERVVTPMIDRVLGQSIERRATTFVAARMAPAVASGVQGTAASASAGFAARTVATRALGSTAVGAVVATGISAYENRDGLARGDSRAIGNVAADTTVAVASIASAAAAGAAIGSVVPVAGTVVGAVVGLAVGVGVAYGAQISGARDWVAGKVSGLVDGIKGWF